MKKTKQTNPPPAFDELQKLYMDALEGGEEFKAEQLIEDSLQRGWSIHSIYLHLLTPAQVEIGELWSQDKLNIAQEHLATQIVLRQMERLRLQMRKSENLYKRIVVTSVEGESHMVGARMLADFLGADGWAVDFLGANTPNADLLQFLQQNKPELLAVSVTIEDHLPTTKQLIQEVKSLGKSAPRVLLGGRAFRGDAALAKELGGDGFAGNALEALQEARRLAGLEDDENTLENFLKTLGKRIQRHRKQAGWSQQKLAELASLDRTYISGVEHGKQNLTLGAVSKIAEALGLSLSDLLKEESNL